MTTLARKHPATTTLMSETFCSVFRFPLSGDGVSKLCGYRYNWEIGEHEIISLVDKSDMEKVFARLPKQMRKQLCAIRPAAMYEHVGENSIPNYSREEIYAALDKEFGKIIGEAPRKMNKEQLQRYLKQYLGFAPSRAYLHLFADSEYETSSRGRRMNISYFNIVDSSVLMCISARYDDEIKLAIRNVHKKKNLNSVARVDTSEPALSRVWDFVCCGLGKRLAA